MHHLDLMKVLNDTSFNHCVFFFYNFDWSSKHLQTNEYDVFDHLRSCSYHHLTKKHPFYKEKLLPSNIYIPFSSMNSTTSYPWSIITALIYSRLIELTLSNEWMWSYKPLNQARLYPNERCTPPLPTSSGSKQ
jgi:hypothetical protein